MNLYNEILINLLEDEEIHITINGLNEIIESSCYNALCKIQSIIRDDTLEDEECFLKIEEVIQVFEKLGSDGGNRHDF